MIDGLNMPLGIAINNKRQLVVAERGGKVITIMERDGKRVQKIECDKFRSPSGVAVGTDGAIYGADDDAHSLFKFSEDGKLCKTLQYLGQPAFVKTIQGLLYVSDYKNNEVKIFDMDCSAVGSIASSEYPQPIDIAEHDGNLYVGSSGKRSIDVYQCHPGGKYIRHVNIKECKLSRGSCFDKCGYLYVVFYESSSEGVYVFDHDSELVTSIGLRKSGLMQDPAGLVIDDDGFVYVCDCVADGKVYVF